MSSLSANPPQMKVVKSPPAQRNLRDIGPAPFMNVPAYDAPGQWTAEEILEFMPSGCAGPALRRIGYVKLILTVGKPFQLC